MTPEVSRSAPSAPGRQSGWPEPVRRSLAEYYTRYYRDALGIPSWRELVAARMDEEAYEAGHLARVERLLGRSLAGLLVLNVGCGTGGFTVTARRAGARCVGVDSEPDAVAICQLKAERGGSAVLGAAEALPFRAGTFDLIYCFSTLEHVADVHAAVAEMVRVTRPGGAVYVHGPNALACYEGHYKLFWLPLMPRALARLYLRLRGRPTGFVDTLNPLLGGRLRRLFRAAGAWPVAGPANEEALPRESGSPLWPLVRAYYRLFGVSPSIEILALKGPDAKV
jgi:SAM-dependent methyltransferase